MPVPAALCSLDSWVHLTPSLLKQGKTKHSDPKPGPGEEEVDPEELMKREVAKDPWEARLKPIAKDNATKGGMPPWIVKSFNTSLGKSDGCVVVRSLWWPGSFTIYANGRCQHVYVGDGQKNEPYSASYYPVQPPKMMSDRAERQVHVNKK